MSQLKTLLFGVALVGLSACAGDDGHNTGTTAYYAAEFQGLDIRRIGNDTSCNREYQNRAISQALDGLTTAGVPREDIESITVSADGCEQGGRANISSAGAYQVWVNVKGCESSVLFQPGKGGTAADVHEESHCLHRG